MSQTAGLARGAPGRGAVCRAVAVPSIALEHALRRYRQTPAKSATNRMHSRQSSATNRFNAREVSDANARDVGPPGGSKLPICCDSIVDGSWTQWSAWSLCSVFCGHGIRQRFRTCQNPGFANHYMEGQQLPGRNCPGKSHDIQTCHQECISDSGRMLIYNRNLDGNSLICLAVRCCEPRPLIDGSFSVLHVTVLKAAEVGYSVGTEIVYECDGDIPGLTLKLTGPRTRRCTSDGNWSGEDPYCVVTTELTSRMCKQFPCVI